MGLLDKMLSANGTTSAPYAKGGRHLVRLTRAYLRDPAEDASITKAGGGFDGVVLNSTRAATDPSHGKDCQIRVNDSFKFPDSALARMRRGAAAALTAKGGKQVDEMTFGLVKEAKEDDKVFTARIVTKIKELFGPTQPLKGSLVVFSCTEHDNKSGKKNPDGSTSTYTLFEVEVPTAEDLQAAGLVPAKAAAQSAA